MIIKDYNSQVTAVSVARKKSSFYEVRPSPKHKIDSIQFFLNYSTYWIPTKTLFFGNLVTGDCAGDDDDLMMTSVKCSIVDPFTQRVMTDPVCALWKILRNLKKIFWTALSSPLTQVLLDFRAHLTVHRNGTVPYGWKKRKIYRDSSRFVKN
jgi:hypothetical protein